MEHTHEPQDHSDHSTPLIPSEPTLSLDDRLPPLMALSKDTPDAADSFVYDRDPNSHHELPASPTLPILTSLPESISQDAEYQGYNGSAELSAVEKADLEPGPEARLIDPSYAKEIMDKAKMLYEEYCHVAEDPKPATWGSAEEPGPAREIWEHMGNFDGTFDEALWDRKGELIRRLAIAPERPLTEEELSILGGETKGYVYDDETGGLLSPYGGRFVKTVLGPPVDPETGEMRVKEWAPFEPISDDPYPIAIYGLRADKFVQRVAEAMEDPDRYPVIPDEITQRWRMEREARRASHGPEMLPIIENIKDSITQLRTSPETTSGYEYKYGSGTEGTEFKSGHHVYHEASNPETGTSIIEDIVFDDERGKLSRPSAVMVQYQGRHITIPTLQAPTLEEAIRDLSPDDIRLVSRALDDINIAARKKR